MSNPGQVISLPLTVIAIHTDADRAHITVSGELDLASRIYLDGAFADVEAAGLTQIRVDLAEVNFIDCYGLAELVASTRRFHRIGGRIEVRPSPAVAWLLQLAGLHDDELARAGDAEGWFTIPDRVQPPTSPGYVPVRNVRTRHAVTGAASASDVAHWPDDGAPARHLHEAEAGAPDLVAPVSL